jgi:hypothetical protein
MDAPSNPVHMIRKENRCDMTRSQRIDRLRRRSFLAPNPTYQSHRDKD